MTDDRKTRQEHVRSVPGIGGPGSEETAPDGRSALRLHAGISLVTAVLSAFTTVVFAVVLGTLGWAIVLAVVTLACIGWGLWAVRRLRATRGLPRPAR